MLQVKSGNMFLLGGSRHLILVAVWLAVLGIFGCAHAASSRRENDVQLRAFLQRYLKKYPSVLDQGIRYSVAGVSLSGNSKRQYLVYLTSRWWCGSGGCTALLLEPGDGSFRVIEKFTLVRLPIRVLASKSHGWHDLAMPVAGGGIINGYMALLRFDGRKYPSNPSMAPRLPVNRTREGTEVPLSEKGIPVY